MSFQKITVGISLTFLMWGPHAHAEIVLADHTLYNFVVETHPMTRPSDRKREIGVHLCIVWCISIPEFANARFACPNGPYWRNELETNVELFASSSQLNHRFLDSSSICSDESDEAAVCFCSWAPAIIACSLICQASNWYRRFWCRNEGCRVISQSIGPLPCTRSHLPMLCICHVEDCNFHLVIYVDPRSLPSFCS